MKTLAYCAQSYTPSVAKAAGVQPLTCPPAAWPGPGALLALEEADFLYLKLHGRREEPYLYGDRWLTAYHTSALAGLDLSGLTVFSACCHFFASPWPAAFAAQGCTRIVAGSDLNWARSRAVGGADRLGRLFRLFCQARMSPHRALDLARLCLSASRDPATRDALQFHFYQPGGNP
jgi:hypothetical protein